jgi:hypothetical protein
MSDTPVVDTTFQSRTAEFHHRMAVQFMAQNEPSGARAARISVGRAIAKLLRHDPAVILSLDYAQDVPFASVRLAVAAALRVEPALNTRIAFGFDGQPANTLSHAAILITVRGLR